MDAINHVKIHPFPSPPFRTALSKPRNLSYFPLKIRSRPKKGENRPRLRTERFGSWVSKIARLIEDTTQKTSANFSPQRYQPSRVTTLQKHRHPASLNSFTSARLPLSTSMWFSHVSPLPPPSARRPRPPARAQRRPRRGAEGRSGPDGAGRGPRADTV